MPTYDRYIEQIRSRKGASQGVLFPEIIELTAAESVILENIKEDLHIVGFDFSNLGGGSYAINRVPAGSDDLDPVLLVRNMIASATEKGSDVKEEIQEKLALTLAESSAIAYGQVLSNQEIVSLVNALFTSEMPNYTPDGLPVLTTWLDEEIIKRFD